MPRLLQGLLLNMSTTGAGWLEGLLAGTCNSPPHPLKHTWTLPMPVDRPPSANRSLLAAPTRLGSSPSLS
jgi:hypothetical protein